MNFSFKSLFPIWSLSQQFHYYFYLSIVSWQYQKYSTILILVMCLLCVTSLVCSSYFSLAPSWPYFSSCWQKHCELFTHTLVLQCSPSTSSRQPQISRVLNFFSTYGSMECHCPGRADFFYFPGENIDIYSRHVRTILQNSRQNPKISKISKLCLSFKCDVSFDSHFCICW